MDIYEKIKNRRIKLGLSQEELALKTGYTSRSSINKIEAGHVDISQSKIIAFAQALQTTPAYLMGWEDNPFMTKDFIPVPKGGKKIPVLGKVVAGAPLEAIEDVSGYIEISSDYDGFGDFFALQIKGDSMSPQINAGDVVVVQRYFELEDGDIVVVSINGDEATCKQVFRQENGIMIQAFNPAVFPSRFYSTEQIEELPVSIIGKVIEARRSFNHRKV